MQACDLLLDPADPLGELVKAPIDVIEPLMEAGEAAPKEVEELDVGHAPDRSVDS
jgi:hypothetical protein